MSVASVFVLPGSPSSSVKGLVLLCEGVAKFGIESMAHCRDESCLTPKIAKQLFRQAAQAAQAAKQCLYRVSPRRIRLTQPDSGFKSAPGFDVHDLNKLALDFAQVAQEQSQM